MHIKHLLSCNQLNKTYKVGNRYINILNNINFSLKYGEMISIIGNSGAGKSTLLHLLAGLDTPTSGNIIFQGNILNRLSASKRAWIRNQELGFIYQFHYLLSDFTILENVALPLLIGGANLITAKKTAKKMLTIVGLDSFISYYPTELSGGEKQRVAIVRSLVNNPKLVFADEPTGNLDIYNADNILKLLYNINENNQTAFIIVTHDITLAKKMHRQLEMKNGTLFTWRENI